MRLTAIAIAAVLAVSAAYGQNPPPDTKAQPPASHDGYEAEVIHIKTLTGDSFYKLANMLSVFDVKTRADANLRTIVVYGPKDVVDQMKKVVAELDTPGSEAAIGRNIEMTMTLLQCSSKAPSGAKLPDDIEAVAKQLRAATQYKDIELWDVIPLRLQEGKTTTEDMMLPAPANRLATLELRVDTDAATRKEKAWSVRLSRLSLDFKIQTDHGFQPVGLTTAGDFLEGQKTVLGKVSGSDSDTAIFVVISLKVLQ